MIKNRKALEEEVLNKIDGGTLRDSATGYIPHSVHISRDNMMLSFDQVRELIIDSYHRNPLDYSTDGSEEDLQEFLRLYEQEWNRK